VLAARELEDPRGRSFSGKHFCAGACSNPRKGNSVHFVLKTVAMAEGVKSRELM
jgi:hypothetical protein